jgi:hypothetical protein
MRHDGRVISPRRLPLVLFVCLCVLAVLAPSACAVETMRLEDPYTDNYKASFNDDPSQPELRTWLAMHAITADGTTWEPADPASIVVSGSNIDVQGADGRSGLFGVFTGGGPLSDPPEIRIDPPDAESRGQWGVLVSLTDRDALQATPGVIRFSLSVGDAVIAVGTVEYRHDASIMANDPGDIEDNGPGGRWFVGGIATRMNWDATLADRPSLLAGAPPVVAAVPPRITSFTVPIRSCSRVITIRVRGRAGSSRITLLRVSVAGHAFSRWVRIAPSYRVVLPPGVGVRSVRAQLRDAAGRRSAIVTRTVRRACG